MSPATPTRRGSGAGHRAASTRIWGEPVAAGVADDAPPGLPDRLAGDRRRVRAVAASAAASRHAAAGVLLAPVRRRAPPTCAPRPAPRSCSATHVVPASAGRSRSMDRPGSRDPATRAMPTTPRARTPGRLDRPPPDAGRPGVRVRPHGRRVTSPSQPAAWRGPRSRCRSAGNEYLSSTFAFGSRAARRRRCPARAALPGATSATCNGVPVADRRVRRLLRRRPPSSTTAARSAHSSTRPRTAYWDGGLDSRQRFAAAPADHDRAGRSRQFYRASRRLPIAGSGAASIRNLVGFFVEQANATVARLSSRAGCRSSGPAAPSVRRRPTLRRFVVPPDGGAGPLNDAVIWRLT